MRKKDFPAERATMGSGPPPASVQPSGTARSLPFESSPSTHSRPQPRRYSMRSNSSPVRGWNGWVMRKRRDRPCTTAAVFRAFLFLQGSRAVPLVRG